MMQTERIDSYEVQLYEGGKWRTDATYEDRLLAEDEAGRLLESSRRPPAVRVIRERFDPDTNLITSTTVFRRSRVDDHNREKLGERLREESVQADARRARGTPRGAGAGAAAFKLHWAWYLMLFLALVLGGGYLLIETHSLLVEH